MVQGRSIDIKATDKQLLAFKVWNDGQVDDLLYGGYAGGGKTMLAGFVLTLTALQSRGSKQFLGRKELKTLMQTSYITLTQKVFPLFGLVNGKDWYLDGKYNVIHFKDGSLIDLVDLAYQPSDPLYDRLGSTEYTRGWIEEASEVPFRAYDVLKARVGRWKNIELGVSGMLGLSLNPSQDWPYRIFYDPWKKAGKPIDPNKPLVSMRVMANGIEVTRTFVFIPASPGDNPYTAGDYERMLATISDPVLRARLRDGDWEYASANDTLFDAATIADLFTNSVQLSSDLFLTVDAARLGGDEIVLTLWRGWDAFRIERYTMLRLPEIAEKVRKAIDSYGIPRDHVLVDEDGIGGGVYDLVPGILGFTANAAPFGKVGEKDVKENYLNLKTQCAYHLATMATARKVRVSETNIETRERIAEDLKQFKRRDAGLDGKLKIVKKEDMKMALGRSPDCGDTLLMRSYFDLRVKEEEFANNGSISIFIPED